MADGSSTGLSIKEYNVCGEKYILVDDGSQFVDCQIARRTFEIQVRVKLLNEGLTYER